MLHDDFYGCIFKMGALNCIVNIFRHAEQMFAHISETQCQPNCFFFLLIESSSINPKTICDHLCHIQKTRLAHLLDLLIYF